MPYVIMKSSHVQQDVPPWSAYRGPTCDVASVPKGKIYLDQRQAARDAEKLSQANSVGFMVASCRGDDWSRVGAVWENKTWLEREVFHAIQAGSYFYCLVTNVDKIHVNGEMGYAVYFDPDKFLSDNSNFSTVDAIPFGYIFLTPTVPLCLGRPFDEIAQGIDDDDEHEDGGEGDSESYRGDDG